MKYFDSFVVACAFVLLLSANLSACDELLCGRNSRAVRGAEKLDKRYLAELHNYVASGQCDRHCTPDILDPLKKFSSRAPVLEVRRDGDASITLAYCFDRGVELVFRDTKTEHATILVGWGSIEWKYIVLWSKARKAGTNPP